MENKHSDIFGFEEDNNNNILRSNHTPPEKRKISTKTITLIAIALIFVIVGSLVGGIFIGANSGMNKDMPLLLETYRMVKKYYYKDISWSEFQEIAAMAFAGSIDPYTGIYVESGATSTYKIGITLINNTYNEHYIDSIYDDYNVAKAKSGSWDATKKAFVEAEDGKTIERGDRLVAIGHKPDGTDSIRVENASKSLISAIINTSPDGYICMQFAKQDDVKNNQPIGSDVTLYNYYFEMSKPNKVDTLAKYYSSDIVGEGAGLIKFTGFDDSAVGQFANAVEQFVNDPASPKKLILDLRNNGGGDSNVLGFVANYFIDKKGQESVPIGRFVGNTGNGKMKETYFSTLNSYKDVNNKTYNSDYIGKRVSNFECVILTDKNSASSSELLLAAMQHYSGTEFVGGKTYGKGVAQTVRLLSSGHTIYITNGYYYIPTYDENNKIQWTENIHGKGLEPKKENQVSSSPKRFKDDPYVKRALQLFK